MKGSEFGDKPCSMVGKWAWSRNENGNGDGIWHNYEDDRDSAIAELKADCEMDGIEFHGYVTQLQEADIPMIDANAALEQISVRLNDTAGELSEQFPECSKEQREILEAKLNKVFVDWLTEFNLWPNWAICGAIEEVGEAIESESSEPESAEAHDSI